MNVQFAIILQGYLATDNLDTCQINRRFICRWSAGHSVLFTVSINSVAIEPINHEACAWWLAT